MMMPIARIYQAIPLNLHASIQLDDKAAHHVARVLRAKIGDKLILFNGEGGEYETVISEINKKKVTVEIIHFYSHTAESPLDIYLAQGIARGEKMDFIMQKAVELGVKKIMPLITERCNVRLNETREKNRMLHWQSVMIHACEQSGRHSLPEITEPRPFVEWVTNVKADYRFVLSPHANNKLPPIDLPPHTSIVLLVGPEGGLSEQEIKMALEQGFLPLNLGPRILRTETAGLAAISIFQFNFGDQGCPIKK